MFVNLTILTMNKYFFKFKITSLYQKQFSAIIKNCYKYLDTNFYINFYSINIS